MRTLLLLSTLVVIAACSDNQTPTSPMRGGAASGNVAPSGQGIKVPDAKPSGPVAFTKVTYVYASALQVPAGSFNVQDAICPAGTVLVGGGHELGSTGGTAPLVWRSRPHLVGANGADGWSIAVDNTQAGSALIYIQAWANCAS
jgi:hypothetical protein